MSRPDIILQVPLFNVGVAIGTERLIFPLGVVMTAITRAQKRISAGRLRVFASGPHGKQGKPIGTVMGLWVASHGGGHLALESILKLCQRPGLFVVYRVEGSWTSYRLHDEGSVTDLHICWIAAELSQKGKIANIWLSKARHRRRCCA